MKKRIGIFGGGGALGAYTVGILSELRPIYKVAQGTSTGALIACLAALGRYDDLVEAYSNIDNEDMFDYNLFNKRDKMKKWYIVYRIIIGKLSISNIGNKLEKLVREYFTEEDFLKLKELDKEVVVTAQRIDTYPNKVRYFSSKEVDYETFVKAVIASASVPMFSDPVTIEDGLYVDGGVTENIPTRIKEEHSHYDKDIFLHSPKIKTQKTKQAKNIFMIVINLIKLMIDEIRRNDLGLNRLCAEEVTRVFYTPYKLADNSLFFDKGKMREWIDLGREEAKKYKNK